MVEIRCPCTNHAALKNMPFRQLSRWPIGEAWRHQTQEQPTITVPLHRMFLSSFELSLDLLLAAGSGVFHTRTNS